MKIVAVSVFDGMFAFGERKGDYNDGYAEMTGLGCMARVLIDIDNQ